MISRNEILTKTKNELLKNQNSNEQYIIENAGHINTESGYTKFEEILKVI